MILGAHISTKGGLTNVLDRAQDLAIQAIQIHPSLPQQWAKPKITDDEARIFVQEMKKRELGPLFFHAIYLINFASKNPAIWHGSITSTINYLKLAKTMNAAGVITHLGSTKGALWQDAKKRVVLALRRIFDDLRTSERRDDPVWSSLLNNQKPKFIIETAAGAGNVIGDDLDEIAQIFQAVQDDYPCGICIDTAHLFESGIQINTEEEFNNLLQQIDSVIGLKNLVAIHLNDSMTDFNSKCDRHENIGQGKIGDEALARIINHPQLRQLPFILEVPGFEGAGPDKQNITHVKSLLKQLEQ